MTMQGSIHTGSAAVLNYINIRIYTSTVLYVFVRILFAFAYYNASGRCPVLRTYDKLSLIRYGPRESQRDVVAAPCALARAYHMLFALRNMRLE
jgi:hypothetical protein